MRSNAPDLMEEPRLDRDDVSIYECRPSRQAQTAHQFLAGKADGFAGTLGRGAAGGAAAVGQPEGGVVIHLHSLDRQRPLILRQRLAQLVHRHLASSPQTFTSHKQTPSSHCDKLEPDALLTCNIRHRVCMKGSLKTTLLASKRGPSHMPREFRCN